jgi:uncharacterized membrane protein
MRAARSLVRMVTIGAVLIALGTVSPVVAQNGAQGRHCRYRVVDVGTLGGSVSLFYNFDQVNFTPAPLNDAGELAVTSLTSASFAAAALWSRGVLSALANLPNANVGGGGSNANGINALGVVVGAADDGVINPRNGQPYDHAVRWDRGGVERLQELDGHASWANFITDQGVVIGYANNAVPDPYTYAGTQTRAVIWRGGVAQDLGTLGGTDSAAFAARRCHEGASDPELLTVIGTSSLDTMAGPPFGIPQTDAFIWSEGVMKDLGSLGGGFSTPSAINCRGQVAVISFDATNQHFQSFVWTDGRRVLLEPLQGHFVEAAALDDDTDVVGAVSDAADQNALAAIWGPSGQGRVLGAIGSDTGSIALDINSRGIVVGGSGMVSFSTAASYAHAFVARREGAIEDLNTLIPASSPLTLHVAYAVNDRGEIAGLGTNAAGETHAFILVPNDGGDEPDLQPAARAVGAPGRAIRTGAFRRIGDGLRKTGLRP